ncbi:MAG TPA: VWA domain-containing protein [Polyangiaceae bacterium]|nr:VWA domain-containing protein [Polyangiaceae bacterium]
MFEKALLQIVAMILTLLAAGVAGAADKATLSAPASVPAGARFSVAWTGPGRQWDRIGIVPAGAPDVSPGTPQSAYASTPPAAITAPDLPGEYEVRYFGRDPTAVLARRKITVSPVTATLSSPANAISGARLEVKYTGPANGYDRIYIVKAGSPEKTRSDFSTPAGASPVHVLVPEAPGDYEVRYLTGQLALTLARAPLHVTGTTASVEGPRSALAGATIDVKWTGPKNEYDRIYVVKAGAPDQTSSDFSAPAWNSPTRVTVPEAAGEYEIRYATGQTRSTLAKAPLTITSASASLQGPGSTTAGSYFKVSWKGPGNAYDHISIARKDAGPGEYLKSFRIGPSPMQIHAPLVTGEFELRYQTGQTQATLARAALVVTPARQEPGLIRVSAAEKGASSGGGAVEVIVDASGSMLQQIGSERRIDIAKRTLKNLTNNVIPAGTPFALRVFGREANSCQTELEIAPHPLDRVAVAGKIDALSAKSNAKTPIAASLEKVSSDLREVHGERLVILLTDGEETCGGNPAATIETLMKQGIDVRINIVGFAVDDQKTVALFRQWSSAGGGDYFDARNAASLESAFSQAVKPGFEIIDAQKKVVATGLVGDEPVKVLPGKYTVRLKGAATRSQSVTVKPSATTNVGF